MKGAQNSGLDFIIDKLTNSIENSTTGEVFDTEVSRLLLFMHLIESAKFNKGRRKVYLGVPGNLVAYACKASVEKGYEGFLAFDAKSALIKHYEQSLFATRFRGQRMFIDSVAASRLIAHYFKS